LNIAGRKRLFDKPVGLAGELDLHVHGVANDLGLVHLYLKRIAVELPRAGGQVVDGAVALAPQFALLIVAEAEEPPAVWTYAVGSEYPFAVADEHKRRGLHRLGNRPFVG